MTNQPTRHMEAREGEDVFFVERILRPDGSLFVPADFGGANPVRLRIYDRTSNNPLSPIHSPADSAVAGVVVSPAVVDGMWEGRDSTGYNFIFRLLSASFRPTGGKIYDVEFALTGTFNAVAIIKTVVFRLSVSATSLVT